MSELSSAVRSVWDSVVRTITPVVVAAVVSVFVSAGIEVDPGLAESISLLVGALSGTVFYFAARIIETRWPKWSKWLLLNSKQPVDYEKPDENAGQAFVYNAPVESESEPEEPKSVWDSHPSAG